MMSFSYRETGDRARKLGFKVTELIGVSGIRIGMTFTKDGDTKTFHRLRSMASYLNEYEASTKKK